MIISRLLAFMFLAVFSSMVKAQTEICYSAYDFHSLSKMNSSVQGVLSKQNITISLSLYLKKISNAQGDKKYTRVLGVVKDLKVESDNNDHGIADIMSEIFSYPFVVTLDENNNVQAVDVPPDNRKYITSVIGLLQNIFIPKNEGEYFELTAEGLAKVQYRLEDGKIHKKRLGIYNRKKEQDKAFQFPESEFLLASNKDDCLRVGVTGHEKYKIISEIDNSRAKAYLKLNVKYNKEKTAVADHVLANVNSDMSEWRRVEQGKSRKFSLKEREQLARQLSEKLNSLDKRDEKLALINAHLDLLMDLNLLIQEGLLEDRAVMAIMWGLGVIDTRQTVSILNNVIIDSELNEENRFRALRGLAMTKTSLTPRELSGLTIYLDQDYRKSNFDSNIVLTLGELAANRLETDPEQTAFIEDAIAQHIQSSVSQGEPDHIAITAARNMQEAASDTIVDTVVDTLATNSNRVKASAADALAQFSKREQLVPVIKEQLAKEKSPDVVANFIKAYAKHGSDSVDFAPKMKTYAMNRQHHDEVREAAVNGLLGAGYGKNQEEKQDLKSIMINEQDPSIIRSISTAVYAPPKPERVSNLRRYE